MREADQKTLIQEQFERVKALHPKINEVELIGHDFVRFRAMEPASRRHFKFQLDVRRFDLEPPRLGVLHPQTGREMPHRGSWPWLSGFTFDSLHPQTQRPWACMRGLWEYHVHYSHQNDPWDLHRNKHTLDYIVLDLLGKLSKPPVPQRLQAARVRGGPA